MVYISSCNQSNKDKEDINNDGLLLKHCSERTKDSKNIKKSFA